MSTDSEKKTNEPRKRHLLLDELRELMSSLQNLYFSISSKVLYRRMQPSERSSSAGDSADIAASLQSHLEQEASLSQKEQAERAAADARQTESETQHSGARRRAKKGRSGLGLLGALSKHFRKGGVAEDGLPYMSEKMQANTMDHINQALRLAKQGNAQGAKMHADLAENAMKTASEYMPEEKYKVFKRNVETRLKSILR